VPGSNLVPEVSPDGRYVLYTANVGPNRRQLRVVELKTGERVPFAIDVDWSQGVSSQILWGRARWTPDGKRIAFVEADEQDRSGVFVRDFVPGRDTRATRRPLAGFSSKYLTESLGLSPDGRHLTIATLHQTSGLSLAEGLTGVAPPHTDETR
jgi:Tol biopolymer transport system component